VQRTRRLLAILALPVVALALWLGSGREVLTKHTRIVGVAVRDDLFGDVNIVQQPVPGPIFGYYVGLDVVVLAILLALLIGVIGYFRYGRSSPRNEESA
jgi:hypothetical protein